MAFGFIQSNATSLPTDQTLSLAYDLNVTPSSLLLAAVWWGSTTSATVVSDASNGTWTAIGSPTVGSGAIAGYRRQMFYVAAAAAGATTVDSDCGAVVDHGLAIHEFSAGATPTIDGTPRYDNVDDSTTPTTGSISVANAADLLFAICVNENGGITEGAGYTAGLSAADEGNWGNNLSEYDLDGGASGSKTASFTQTLGDAMLGFATFKEATAAPVYPTLYDYSKFPKAKLARVR